MRVAIYKTTAEDTHLNTPNVTRFKGRSRRLIAGFAKNDTAVIAAPVRSNVYKPFSNTKPPAISVTTQRENVSIA
jgi:hypothetical protein